MIYQIFLQYEENDRAPPLNSSTALPQLLKQQMHYSAEAISLKSHAVQSPLMVKEHNLGICILNLQHKGHRTGCPIATIITERNN